MYIINTDKNYIEKSDRFISETKGTIFNEVNWKKCSSIKGDDGYVFL